MKKWEVPISGQSYVVADTPEEAHGKAVSGDTVYTTYESGKPKEIPEIPDTGCGFDLDTFELKYSETKKNGHTIQEIWSDTPGAKMYINFHDLDECPEDAVIGRDLFDASDYINAIRFGFRLANVGYDEIVIKELPWED